MTTTSIQERVDELFADAHQVYEQAIERLEQGDIRDAAEKAWCATKRATDAVILVRTGDEPVTTSATTNNLDSLARQMPDVRRLQGRYYSRIHNLHGCVSTPGSATTRPNAASGRP